MRRRICPISPAPIRHLYSLGYRNIPANCVFEDVWKEHHPKQLYDQLIELADWMIDNEIYKDLYTSLFEERFVQKPSQEEYERQKTTAFCGGNGRMMAFGPDGKVYPCLRYMKHSLSNQPERPIGELSLGLYTDKEHTEWFQRLPGRHNLVERGRRVPGLPTAAALPDLYRLAVRRNRRPGLQD